MTVIKNRDVPGGKEFWDHVENVAANFQPPEIKSDSIGGRGMMTAEQINEYVAWIKFERGLIKVCDSDDPKAFAVYKWATVESYAAAQLAEKEREIAQLSPHTVEDGFGSSWPPCEKHDCSMQVMRPGDARCPHCENEDYANRLIQRAEAAEQRLQEAQAEIRRLHKLFGDLTPGGSEFAGDPDYCAKYLRDRANTQTDLLKKKFIELRQREAELEQRWIAVSERIPEFEEPVWGLLPFENGKGYALAVVMRDDGEDGWLWHICDEGRMFEWPFDVNASFECDDDYRVKYWLPITALPSPPKAQP